MKILRVSDVIHKQLKREAESEGRTLQWIVETKLTGTTFHQPATPQSPVPKKQEPEKNSTEQSSTELLESLDNMERACCTAKSPCRHWSFDSVEDVWVNSFSGRERSE